MWKPLMILTRTLSMWWWLENKIRKSEARIREEELEAVRIDKGFRNFASNGQQKCGSR
jgi:hypothetical protein